MLQTTKQIRNTLDLGTLSTGTVYIKLQDHTEKKSLKDTLSNLAKIGVRVKRWCFFLKKNIFTYYIYNK
jgi:hypothetical protein